MTVPIERTNSVIWTENFLLRLTDPKQTPRVPKSVRQEAHRLLRHYPSKFHMDFIASKEDGETNTPIDIKIFGKGYS